MAAMYSHSLLPLIHAGSNLLQPPQLTKEACTYWGEAVQLWSHTGWHWHRMCTTSGEARARARVIVPRFTVEGPRSTFPETVAFRASHRGTYQIGKTCGVRMGAVYWRDMIHYTN